MIRELGFANLAMGLFGAATLVVPSWRPAGALVGGVFYGLAAVNHALQPKRARLANVALVSDAFVAVVLLASLIGSWPWGAGG